MLNLKHESLCGYDLLLTFNDKLGITLSPGTVYATLSNMERDGLISSELHARKRVYELTDQGTKALEAVLEDAKDLHEFIRSLLLM